MAFDNLIWGLAEMDKKDKKDIIRIKTKGIF